MIELTVSRVLFIFFSGNFMRKVGGGSCSVFLYNVNDGSLLTSVPYPSTVRTVALSRFAEFTVSLASPWRKGLVQLGAGNTVLMTPPPLLHEHRSLSLPSMTTSTLSPLHAAEGHADESSPPPRGRTPNERGLLFSADRPPPRASSPASGTSTSSSSSSQYSSPEDRRDLSVAIGASAQVLTQIMRDKAGALPFDALAKNQKRFSESSSDCIAVLFLARVCQPR